MSKCFNPTSSDKQVKKTSHKTGLMGSLFYLLIATGGVEAFTHAMSRHANTRNKSLLITWLLGLAMFLDDYLNAIVIGNSMKKVTDKFKVSRSMLAYIVDSTAAPALRSSQQYKQALILIP